MTSLSARPALIRRLAPLGGLVAIALVAALVARPVDAAEPSSCSAEFRIDRAMPSGARWQMCWELRALEGVVLHDVTYTPPGGPATEVLGAMNLAQIHVAYDDDGLRLHQVSDVGLGNGLVDLDSSDCGGPGSNLHGIGTTGVLCEEIVRAGYAYKSYTAQRQMMTLRLFSVSGIGADNYVVRWNFDEDGSIRPEVGATGRLQRYGGGRATGWNVGHGQFAVAHAHTYYWRLDFDLNGPADDQVQELAASISGDRQSFVNTRVPFPSEVARRVLPGSFRSWRVLDPTTTNTDGHDISYELVPNTDYVFRGPSYEPFTQNQLYVTRRNGCERFASHNPTLGGACGSNVADFANGGTLGRRADPVVWYSTSFHHLPRDEDEAHADIEWTGFSMISRDLTASYPIP